MAARLFTYTIPFDDGAAPNPFHGMCSLAICKPSIRRVAKEGDWVVGLGSKNAPGGDLSGRMVYGMHVQQVMSLAEYDRRVPKEWALRIPNLVSRDLADRLGDCIYDYSHGDPPAQRPSVHGPGNIATDLGGKNVLLSTDFYYFGSRAVPLPQHLLGIQHQTQAHKSDANPLYFEPFVRWIRGMQLEPGQLYGWPDRVLEWLSARAGRGCGARASESDTDLAC